MKRTQRLFDFKKKYHISAGKFVFFMKATVAENDNAISLWLKEQ